MKTAGRSDDVLIMQGVNAITTRINERMVAVPALHHTVNADRKGADSSLLLCLRTQTAFQGPSPAPASNCVPPGGARRESSVAQRGLQFRAGGTPCAKVDIVYVEVEAARPDGPQKRIFTRVARRPFYDPEKPGRENAL